MLEYPYSTTKITFSNTTLYFTCMVTLFISFLLLELFLLRAGRGASVAVENIYNYK